MRYKKTPTPLRPALLSPPIYENSAILGMLYVVSVNVLNKITGENAKHSLLLVGCEIADIERKIKWIFDTSENSVTIKGIEKVREKVHFLSTVITKDSSEKSAVIMRDEGSVNITQNFNKSLEEYDPKLFAIGIVTTMMARDAEHALRKVSTGLMNRATVGKSHTGAQLSDDSTISVEEIPRSSGFAMSRDVSNEVNKAHFVRG